MKDDKLKIKAAKLYHTLLPNGGSFHILSPSTRTYKEFMALVERNERTEVYVSKLEDILEGYGYFDARY